MTRAFRALTAEPWAIEHSWLPVLAAIAQRETPVLPADASWARQSLELMAGPSGRRLEGSRATMVTDAGIAMIPIFGPIFPRANMLTDISGATTCQAILADYRLSLNSAEVDAVMFLIDSPGGQVSGIAALADAMFAGRKVKPSIAHAVGNCASAALWLGTQPSQLSVDRTSVAGSLGVCAAVSKQKEPDGEGEMAFDIVSSNAPDKVPDPETEAGLAQIVSMLDALEAQFIGDVARGRGIKAAKVKSDFGRGGVLVGQAAVDVGMADAVSSFDAVYGGLAKQIGNKRRVAALKG